jgi:Ca2+-binding RTX toxin-like protein
MLTLGTGLVTVQDLGVAPTAGAGCAPAGMGRVSCAAAAPAVAGVTLGDGNHTLAVAGALAVTVNDGDGNDSISGGNADDVFLPSPGADTYTGGGGLDAVDYSDRTAAVTLDLDGFADDGTSKHLGKYR